MEANDESASTVAKRVVDIATSPPLGMDDTDLPPGGSVGDAVGTIVATADDSNSATSGLSLHTPLGTNLRPQGSALTPYEAEYPPLSTSNHLR